MSTYLLKWNPKRWQWNTLAQDVEAVRRKGFVDDGWSCGNTKRIERGDSVFLLRTGTAPRGIVASGVVTEEPYEEAHWDKSRPRDKALYVGVRFYALLNPEHDGILAIEDLRTEHLANFPWHLQAGGITVPPAAAAELESAWSAFLVAQGQQPLCLPDEVPTPARFFEGATRQIAVNVYERNPYARQRCIEHYGCRCSVCDFDFEQVFGEIGRAFIHVHHLRALSDIQSEYEIDPIADLRPICPNCHAMIHHGTEMTNVEQLRELIQTQKAAKATQRAGASRFAQR
jgi:5-methylcytosine-specific restriction protein A